MSTAEKKRPVKTIGPFAKQIGIDIWHNDPKDGAPGNGMYSATVRPPRYQDKEDGEWKDSKSWNLTDLRTLHLAIEGAIRYLEDVTRRPRSQATAAESSPEGAPASDGSVPF